MYRLFYWILLNLHPYYMSGHQHTDVNRDYPNFFSLAVLKLWQKATLGKKGFIWLTHPDHRISLKEVRAGTQAQAEESPWGKVAYWFVRHGLLSWTTQDHFHRNGSTHTELHPPTSITNENKYAPTDLLTVNVMGAVSPLTFLFPRWLQFVSSWQN